MTNRVNPRDMIIEKAYELARMAENMWRKRKLPRNPLVFYDYADAPHAHLFDSTNVIAVYYIKREL